MGEKNICVYNFDATERAKFDDFDDFDDVDDFTPMR